MEENANITLHYTACTCAHLHILPPQFAFQVGGSLLKVSSILVEEVYTTVGYIRMYTDGHLFANTSIHMHIHTPTYIHPSASKTTHEGKWCTITHTGHYTVPAQYHTPAACPSTSTTHRAVPVLCSKSSSLSPLSTTLDRFSLITPFTYTERDWSTVGVSISTVKLSGIPVLPYIEVWWQ